MVTENTEPTAEGEPTQPVEAATPTGESTAEPTYTQEQVNQMMGKTRREERGKFSDYGTLKERAAKADELEQAQLTEKERLEARVEQAEKQAQAADQRIAEALISTAIQVQAGQMGVVDPEAASLLIDRSNVRYSAEAGVSGVEDALTQLLENKPYLKATNRTPNINPEGGQPDNPVRLTADQREAAKYLGMSEEQYSKGL